MRANTRLRVCWESALALLLWLGRRAALAMATVHALMSVLALRGHRVAAVGLFALALSTEAVILAVLGNDAFYRAPVSTSSDLSALRDAARETTRWAFYGGAAVGAIAAGCL